MTVEPLENGVYLSFGGNGLYYSIDDSDWISLPMDTNTPSINVGQTIKIKGLNIRTDSFYSHFSINGRCKLSGTIMSIIYGDKPYEEKIPLAGCFAGAFYNCTSIVEVAPDFLPATTLAHSCYYAMFHGCDSLTTVPELPATTLTEDCYNSMFAGCSKLNYIKMLATDISAPDCLYNWVSGVASTGTFVKNPAMTSLPTAALSNQYAGIPSGWTVIDDGEDSGNGLEFPLYLTFDYCDTFVMTYCYGEGDYAELRRFIIDVCKTHYDDYSNDFMDTYNVYEDTLDSLGIEIYVEGQKITTLSYEGAYNYAWLENNYYFTRVQDTYIDAEY